MFCHGDFNQTTGGMSARIQSNLHSWSLGNNQVEQFPATLNATLKCCVQSISSVKMYHTSCFLHFAATYDDLLWAAEKPHLLLLYICELPVRFSCIALSKIPVSLWTFLLLKS